MPFPRVTLTGSHGRWDDCDFTFMITMTIKHEIFKCIKCKNKGDELYDVPTRCIIFLKYDSFGHQIGGICHI